MWGVPCKSTTASEGGRCSQGTLLVKTVVGHRAAAAGQRASCLGSTEDRVKSPMSTAPSGAQCYKSFTLKMSCLFFTEARISGVWKTMTPALWLYGLVLLLPTESCRILCQVQMGESGWQTDRENASVASFKGWSVRGRRGWGGPAQPEEMTMTGDRKDRLATNLSHVNLPNRFWNPAKLM